MSRGPSGGDAPSSNSRLPAVLRASVPGWPGNETSMVSWLVVLLASAIPATTPPRERRHPAARSSRQNMRGGRRGAAARHCHAASACPAACPAAAWLSRAGRCRSSAGTTATAIRAAATQKVVPKAAASAGTALDGVERAGCTWYFRAGKSLEGGGHGGDDGAADPQADHEQGTRQVSVRGACAHLGEGERAEECHGHRGRRDAPGADLVGESAR